MRIWLVVLTALLVTSCRKASPPVPSIPAATRSWLDLAPGWRLRAVGPMLAGTLDAPLFTSEPATLTDAGLNITLKASEDLLGFETLYYQLNSSRGGALTLRLASATQTIDGKDQPHPAPRPMMRLPDGTRFARLLYLLRASSSDHNMALLSATNQKDLEKLTLAVQSDPAQCQGACQWVPPRVALRAEKLVNKSWMPVEP